MIDLKDYVIKPLAVEVDLSLHAVRAAFVEYSKIEAANPSILLVSAGYFSHFHECDFKDGPLMRLPHILGSLFGLDVLTIRRAITEDLDLLEMGNCWFVLDVVNKLAIGSRGG